MGETEVSMALLLLWLRLNRGFWEQAEHIYLGLCMCLALFYTVKQDISQFPGRLAAGPPPQPPDGRGTKRGVGMRTARVSQ